MSDGREPLSVRERAALADTLIAVGPDAPTLCEGWCARDLAAHLVVRERRPDAAAGLVVPAVSGWLDRVQRRYAERSYPELVAKVRSGPPLLSPFAVPAVERIANATEHFIHHEDLRRAQPGWEPRVLPADDQAALWQRLRVLARPMLRRAAVAVVLRRPDGEETTGGSGEQQVVVTGPPSELLLLASGRTGHARVELDGPEPARRALLRAPLGI